MVLLVITDDEENYAYLERNGIIGYLEKKLSILDGKIAGVANDVREVFKRTEQGSGIKIKMIALFW